MGRHFTLTVAQTASKLDRASRRRDQRQSGLFVVEVRPATERRRGGKACLMRLRRGGRGSVPTALPGKGDGQVETPLLSLPDDRPRECDGDGCRQTLDPFRRVPQTHLHECAIAVIDVQVHVSDLEIGE